MAQNSYAAAPDKGEVYYFLSTDWPPYSGGDLPEQGSSIALARELFQSQHITIQVDFFPWPRVLRLFQQADSKYVGILPKYYNEEQAQTDMLFSKPYFVSPLRLAQRKSSPLHWRTIDDLQHYTLGVGQDYVNQAELDHAIKTGRIRSISSLTDHQNLLKLVNYKVQGSVIDGRVFDYLLHTHTRLIAHQTELELHPTTIEDKLLYVAFRKNDVGDMLRKRFNQAVLARSLP